MQICWAVKPEKQDVPYLLVLEKSPSQEEYIRGTLPHNPYFSTQVGPLMRNVKNFICEQLDLAGTPSTPLPSLSVHGAAITGAAASIHQMESLRR